VKLTYTRSSYIWIRSAIQMTFWKHFVFNCWWVNKFVCYNFMEILWSWWNTIRFYLDMWSAILKVAGYKCYISNSQIVSQISNSIKLVIVTSVDEICLNTKTNCVHIFESTTVLHGGVRLKWSKEIYTKSKLLGWSIVASIMTYRVHKAWLLWRHNRFHCCKWMMGSGLETGIWNSVTNVCRSRG